MDDPANDLWSTIYATIVSLGSVSLGVLMRYSHRARRTGTKIPWARLRYEVPVVLGLTIIAVPVSEYVSEKFGVSYGVLASTCLCLGYLGTRVFDIVEVWLQKFEDEDDDAKDK